MIYRLFVEKKLGLSPAEDKLKDDIAVMLNIRVHSLRKLLRYDIENISKDDLELSKDSIFAENPIDVIYDNIDELAKDSKVIIVEYLPGQFDQRADSAMQCVQLLTMKERPIIRCATVYIIGGVNDNELAKIKKFLINPVESREGSMELPITLAQNTCYEYKPNIIENFIDYNESELKKYYASFGFAMNIEDLSFVQTYFKKCNRNPSLTELKVIDTYWSDHCRHTTFATEFKSVKILSNVEEIAKAYAEYEQLFNELYKDRPDKYKCLMDVATIIVKKLKKDGYLANLDLSDEINACSVIVNVDVNGIDEEWLIMFKNETHNHPTEIEPFGGAATCLGGAIRDPLSGRTYVYQAMRFTGSADPRESVDKTLQGKLPQRVITKTAASGFSSYGNQIGLATGSVIEAYHDGYKAKRLETGYVIGGAPRKNVVRQKPQAGDLVVLLGGDTGRDGCGGATGSSKSHTTESVSECGAEVQKGNAPEERKLQRLFRNPEVSTMIIKCNDFGAGGVCVAIGELADGIDIYLDRVPKKYDGLTETELAISESQERMAVVIKATDIDKFIKKAQEENIKATQVAIITDIGKLRMFYNDNVVVDIDREFLDTNGVKQLRDIKIVDNYEGFFDNINIDTKKYLLKQDIESALINELGRLNVCSTKGLGENFDSTIGAASVLMPFGGKNQITPPVAMASKPPVDGYTTTVTVSSGSYYPYLMSECQFVGSIYSIVASVSKLIATGVDYSTIRLTLQEYFKKLGTDSERWGSPLSALLGAFFAQSNLKLGAIGGKDSMSGSFNELNVPPTLICFAMGIAKEQNIRHNSFNAIGNVYHYTIPRNNNGIPDFDKLVKDYNIITDLIKNGTIKNTTVVEDGGVMVALAKSLMANNLGIKLDYFNIEMFLPLYGDIIVVADNIDNDIFAKIGTLDNSNCLTCGKTTIDVNKLIKAYSEPLEEVFATVKQSKRTEAIVSSFDYKESFKSKTKIAKPRVFIPVFPGTNCEYDTAKAFEMNGAEAKIFVIKNQTADDIQESIKEMQKLIKNSNIIAFPGGFSGGDEPDGSGKFIATTFKNPYLKDAVMELLYARDGLALGICNGFQALIKLGLVPYGKIINQDDNAPTLTFNNIYRHISTISRIRISSNKSAWLSSFKVGDVFNVPISHGEGKFICNDTDFTILSNCGQIATQYVDLNGQVSMISPDNPNGSYNAVEGILSPDGRVFGKMGHTERFRKGLYLNVEGNYDMNIFKNGIKYFD